MGMAMGMAMTLDLQIFTDVLGIDELMSARGQEGEASSVDGGRLGRWEGVESRGRFLEKR